MKLKINMEQTCDMTKLLKSREDIEINLKSFVKLDHRALVIGWPRKWILQVNMEWTYISGHEEASIG